MQASKGSNLRRIQEQGHLIGVDLNDEEREAIERLSYDEVTQLLDLYDETRQRSGAIQRMPEVLGKVFRRAWF